MRVVLVCFSLFWLFLAIADYVFVTEKFTDVACMRAEEAMIRKPLIYALMPGVAIGCLKNDLWKDPYK
jgi:mitochondrial fission protein ELM1